MSLLLYTPGENPDGTPDYTKSDCHVLSQISNFLVTSHYGGSKDLQFDIATGHALYKYIAEEAWVSWEDTYYLIKGVNKRAAVATVDCELDLDGLKSTVFPQFNYTEQTFSFLVEKALAATGWTVTGDTTVPKRCTVDLKDVRPIDILEKLAEDSMFNVVYSFQNSGSKVITVSVPTNNTTATGAYFTDELNLKDVSLKGSSSDFCTRLYCYGKEGKTFADINGGKPYVDNTEYKDTVVAAVWRDEKYENMTMFLQDAKAKLKVLSRPDRSYTCKILDLAKVQPELYGGLKFSLYDVITLIDRALKLSTNHRIVEYKQYPFETERNEATLSMVTAKITTTLSKISKRVNELNVDSIIDREKVNEINRTVDANVLRIKETNEKADALESRITQTAQEIRLEVSKKVGNEELGTKITQNASSVQIAWNNISQIIQFAAAQLQIYNSSGAAKNLLMALGQSGMMFYRDSTRTIGHIGLRSLSTDTGKKSLAFNVDKDGDFLSWASTTDEGNAIIRLAYYKKNISVSGYPTLYQGFNFSDTVYMNNSALYLGSGSVGVRTICYASGEGFKHSGNMPFVISNSSDQVQMSVGGAVNIYETLNMNGNSIVGQSDARLKENIKDTQVSALELINQIDLKQFDWIENGAHEPIGVIAQQLQQIAPELVHKDTDTGLLGVKTDRFIWYLLKAVQELSQAPQSESAAPRAAAVQKKAAWTDNFTPEEKNAAVSRLCAENTVQPPVKPPDII